MYQDKIKILSESYHQHIMKCRVVGDYGQLAVLSDIHMGLNNRKYFQNTIKNLLSLGGSCKVIIGGDSTNTITPHSKGDILEEELSGDEQIFALAEDMKPLYQSGQLLGLISGNHNQRAYNDAYITIEAMLASILGDRSLYKGEMGIVYFNVNENCYIHHILHKHKRTKHYYDYFNADVTWFEHFHEPAAIPKVFVDHNKYTKKPIVRECWELHQSSFQVYPRYTKASGIRPSLTGYWVAEMTGDKRNKKVTPFMDNTYFDMLQRGYHHA